MVTIDATIGIILIIGMGSIEMVLTQAVTEAIEIAINALDVIKVFKQMLTS